jgi:hypothetical protein
VGQPEILTAIVDGANFSAERLRSSIEAGICALERQFYMQLFRPVAQRTPDFHG